MSKNKRLNKTMGSAQASLLSTSNEETEVETITQSETPATAEVTEQVEQIESTETPAVEDTGDVESQDEAPVEETEGAIEPQPEKVTVEETEVHETPAVQEESVFEKVAEAVETVVEEAVEAVTDLFPAVSDIVAELQRYATEMAPGKAHPSNEGVNSQVLLYRTIETVLNSTGERFEQGMRALIKHFADYRIGCMGERYLYRYMANLPLSPSARADFTRLLNLFSAAAVVPSNLALVAKSVDVVATVASLPGPVQSRVLEFFQV